MSDKKIILVGYSGHAFVVAETLIDNGFEIIGYSEREEVILDPYNFSYLGFESNEEFGGWNLDCSYAIGIGDNKLRSKIADLIESKGKTLPNIIHKTAQISATCKIYTGNFINKNVTINALVQIGKNVILNTGCIIEHECVIGDGVHIAPGAVLAGNVTVGKGSFIGANSVVKQGVKIGEDVVIGAGSVIISDISDGNTIVGNPGRIIK
ncbi:acetyltransferase [Flavobacterium sp. B183]|uniref:acetyltransferase n=1 Tax=Flavobacterium sp. B183 TaxID=907046 RepID=UPI00201F257A|nr:acetyltransferase [Flavobacterium sp. B183]URC13114.1 acetyltransferase [Flavobacterium sp. B183]